MKEKLDRLVGQKVLVSRLRLGVTGTLKHGKIYDYNLGEDTHGWACFKARDVEAIDTNGDQYPRIWLKEQLD